jgi:hypothetical protein
MKKKKIYRKPPPAEDTVGIRLLEEYKSHRGTSWCNIHDVALSESDIVEFMDKVSDCAPCAEEWWPETFADDISEIEGCIEEARNKFCELQAKMRRQIPTPDEGRTTALAGSPRVVSWAV